MHTKTCTFFEIGRKKCILKKKSNSMYKTKILCHSHLYTEQLIYISALSKLRESEDISAFRYTNLNGIVVKYVERLYELDR